VVAWEKIENKAAAVDALGQIAKSKKNDKD